MYVHFNDGPYPVYTNVQPAGSGPLPNYSVSDALLAGTKREASLMDLYRRLADKAPDQKHKELILQALALKNIHFNQFASLYRALTGIEPIYETDPIAFDGYEDGLRIAREAGLEGWEQYRGYGDRIPYPPIRQVFLYASSGEQENAMRLGSLDRIVLKDYGPDPFVVNIEEAAETNNTYRTALWTGNHLQVTVMSIGVGDDIGLEVHPDTDQFIRIEEGQGFVQMGDSRDRLDFQAQAYEDYAIMIPAGKWHNVTNTGNQPLKVYVIYAPPEHPRGTVHPTKADAMASEAAH
ncbi:cupin domain-containing protein [Paenibacillus humicola]|uniref:cupin domain-containing protein n=1 Tax=Paenibacillus humicola TaxID=3110540 RepID=UPI00237A35B4|nr:cupin domain-containing protein [Paenibacillus humicola]